jgi:serine/threonine protein kinase
MRDFITKCLQEKPEDRATINELLHHSFLEKASNDHDLIKLSPELTTIIKKHYTCKKISKNIINGSCSTIENHVTKSINDSVHGNNDMSKTKKKPTHKVSNN